MPTAILFYDVVLFVHIAAILIAFGVTFAYPLIDRLVATQYPRSLPAVHRAQAAVGQKIIAPAGGVALLAGAYLATDRDLWNEVWVTVPATILVILLAAGGLFFGPHETRAADLAERDIAASGEGEVRLSAEYEAVQKRIASVGGLANLLILVALFFMTAKPFA